MALVVLAAACGGEGGVQGTAPPATPPATEGAPGRAEGGPRIAFARVDATTLGEYAASGDDSIAPWRRAAPRIEDVAIPSSLGAEPQPALWLAPRGDRPRPLLVVLHSWSNGYLQAANVPFAEWADRLNWAMVAPDFRGVFETPEATGSDLAVQDVVDSVDWALRRGGVDGDHVYVIGFSGGGMMSLLMAGRHPERFAGAVSWVPVYDLNDWYPHNVANQPDRDYARQIRDSCGGDPTEDEDARRECARRSPAAHVDTAREAGLPVYIGHGIVDTNVPPGHGMRAFNDLAAEGDRLPAEAVEAARRNSLPADLRGERTAQSYFRGPDPAVIFSRASGPVTFVLFDGDHDAAYNPGLEWITAVAGGAVPTG